MTGILGEISLGGVAILGIVQVSALPQASTDWLPVLSILSPVVTTRMSPDVARCPLGAKLPQVENLSMLKGGHISLKRENDMFF